jgi:hypothetical protein
LPGEVISSHARLHDNGESERYVPDDHESEPEPSPPNTTSMVSLLFNALNEEEEMQSMSQLEYVVSVSWSVAGKYGVCMSRLVLLTFPCVNMSVRSF